MKYPVFFSELKSLAEKTDIKFYAVGGCVRDKLMGIESVYDIDIAVEYRFDEFISIFKKHFNIEEQRISRFKTALFDFGDFTVDIVTARKETYASHGKLPNITESHIEDDLLRRDFTINSIAMLLPDEKYVDPLGGIEDIKKRIIRGNKTGLFYEDPTRIFRLFKYSERFAFTIADETITDLNESLSPDLFEHVSMSRISREWMLILNESKSVEIIQRLAQTGIFDIITGKELNVSNDVCMSIDEPVSSTVAVFRNNETEEVIEICNIMMNGLKKSIIKDIRHTVDAVRDDAVPQKREFYDSVMKRILQ